MFCFARFPRVAATCCPAGRLTLGYVCRAPVGGFWFGAGRPRPAKGPRAILFATGIKRAQVISHAQDDAIGSLTL